MKRLLLVLLLLVTTTQAFVAQAHVHAGVAASSTASMEAAQLLAATQPPVAVADNDSGVPSGDESTCLLCQIAAHGAAALASQQSTLPQIAQQYAIAPAPVTTDPVSLPPTHAWLSRGPPRS